MRRPLLIVGRGTGVDLTPVPALAERLASPGTVFARVFTDREWAYCLGLDGPAPAPSGPGGGQGRCAGGGRGTGGGAPGAPARGPQWIPGAPAEERRPRPGAPGPRALASLAARWSAKEAAVKAWSALLSPGPAPIREEDFDWSWIEVVHDPHSRPLLRFSGGAAHALDDLSSRLGAELDWSLSLSHEGGLAIASVLVLALADAQPAPDPQ